MHSVSAIFTAILLSLSGFAQTPGLTADEIAQHHEQAMGRRENIQALTSLVVRGVYHEGGPIEQTKAPLIPHAYQAFLRPYFEAIGDPVDSHPNIREGFDGSSWEYYGDPGVTIRTVGAAAAASRHASEFLQDSLLDYRLKGTRLLLEGEEAIGGSSAYRIHVTLSDGSEKLMFVDKQNFLITAERKSAPIHAFGQAVATESRFYNYHPVHDVMMWQSARETEIVSGKVFNEFRRVSIEANTLSDAAQFSPPSFEKTALQSWLEQLFAERTDEVSVMYSYRLFRQAHPEIDTRGGIEFIGYQMLKMGEFKAAASLLESNAGDYPKSASAQFGLGRAYKAAGDLKQARSAFSRALEIDPTFKKATDGLNALR